MPLLFVGSIGSRHRLLHTLRFNLLAFIPFFFRDNRFKIGFHTHISACIVIVDTLLFQIVIAERFAVYYFSVICLLVVLDKDFDSHVIPLVFPQVLTD